MGRQQQMQEAGKRERQEGGERTYGYINGREQWRVGGDEIARTVRRKRARDIVMFVLERLVGLDADQRVRPEGRP